jgi:IS1 family transposase
MWKSIPKSYFGKQVYTDDLNIYPALIAYWRHWVCPKGCGDTNIAEGCNNYLRHRVSYLVRKSPSFARNVDWLKRRVLWVLYSRNERIKKELTTAKNT